MIHLPKKRPWLILVCIYLIIVLVWGIFFYLANQANDPIMDREEADRLFKTRQLLKKEPLLNSNAK